MGNPDFTAIFPNAEQINDLVAGQHAIANAIRGERKNGVVFGFHIDGSESDPELAVTYLGDALGLIPAHMDYSAGKFNYGSWADAFFLPRPCMLKYDGTVDYYLDRNDYTKKADGTASDIADTAYGGNAMMEWGDNGIIWYKVVPDAGDPNSASVYIADHKADDGFVAWSFINNQGQLVPHFYTPIYTGSNDGNGKMRSLSGLAPTTSTTATQETTAARSNNADLDILWDTEVLADIILINFLLILMGKSLDTQTVFGQGYHTGASSAANLHASGLLNDKGLFFGYNDGSHSVKVFGMENWWGNHWRRYAGHLLVGGTQKVKLTHGTQDGSTDSDYDQTGSGYLTVTGATPTGTSSGYISKVLFNALGMFAYTASGDSDKYFCDGLWFANSGTKYALRGGGGSVGLLCGAFYVYLSFDPGHSSWSIGAALSCKPRG